MQDQGPQTDSPRNNATPVQVFFAQKYDSPSPALNVPLSVILHSYHTLRAQDRDAAHLGSQPIRGAFGTPTDTFAAPVAGLVTLLTSDGCACSSGNGGQQPGHHLWRPPEACGRTDVVYLRECAKPDAT